jgi:hypothetical protein
MDWAGFRFILDIFFIMVRIFSNFLRSLPTSATEVPDPRAIRERREGPMIR